MTTDVCLQEEKNLPVITADALPQEEGDLSRTQSRGKWDHLQFWQDPTCLESNDRDRMGP